MIQRGVPVPELSRDKIAAIACKIRLLVNADGPLFPIVKIVEGAARDGFEVVEPDEMGNDLGLTYPDQGRIVVRRDIYDAACAGRGLAREVMAHELGHLVLHRGIPLPFSRTEGAVQAPTLLADSEWQANTFSELILAPLHIVKEMAASSDIARACGISQETAFRRWAEVVTRCR